MNMRALDHVDSEIASPDELPVLDYAPNHRRVRWGRIARNVLLATVVIVVGVFAMRTAAVVIDNLRAVQREREMVAASPKVGEVVWVDPAPLSSAAASHSRPPTSAGLFFCDVDSKAHVGQLFTQFCVDDRGRQAILTVYIIKSLEPAAGIQDRLVPRCRLVATIRPAASAIRRTLDATTSAQLPLSCLTASPLEVCRDSVDSNGRRATLILQQGEAEQTIDIWARHEDGFWSVHIEPRELHPQVTNLPPRSGGRP